MGGIPGVREKIILGILVLLLITGGVWRAAQLKGPEPVLEHDNESITREVEEETLEPEMVSVHLVGAVQNPGVYELPEGARVYELLEMGGGFSDDADREGLNQARPVFDGEQVYVPRLGEVPEAGPQSDSAKININQASASDLVDLPGIGEVRAGQIIDYRETHGFFTEKEQLMDVSGIGETTFDNIADMITIY